MPARKQGSEQELGSSVLGKGEGNILALSQLARVVESLIV